MVVSNVINKQKIMQLHNENCLQVSKKNEEISEKYYLETNFENVRASLY